MFNLRGGGRKKGMKIGLDVDEVLGNLIDPIMKFHNQESQTNFSKHDVISYGLEELWGGTKEETLEKVLEFYDHQLFHSIQPLPDSQKVLNELYPSHELHVITSRPIQIQQETENWISQYFPNIIEGVHFAGGWANGNAKSKKEICENIGIELMVEDCLEFAEDISLSGTEVLLYDYPWNQKEKLPENITRVYSWQDISNQINPKKKTIKDYLNKTRDITGEMGTLFIPGMMLYKSIKEYETKEDFPKSLPFYISIYEMIKIAGYYAIINEIIN